MRYIGNKTKLLQEIDNLLAEKHLKKQGAVFCDLFSGTATVGGHYSGLYQIIANDILDFSYEVSRGVLLGHKPEFKKLGFDPFEWFASRDTTCYTKGFCYNTFSPKAKRQYFSKENAKYIDYIRDTVDSWFAQKKITAAEKSYLIMCLLEAVSKVANVAGVYSACLKIWDPRAVKKMVFAPVAINNSPYQNKIYCKDANELLPAIKGDILYLDPPYTPTQYNSQYHVLETIARNDRPAVHGVGAHRDNDRLSKWCKKGEVEYEFEKLIKNANFKHIIFSYSDKGIMSARFIECVLKRYAKPGSYVFKKISFVKYKSSRSVDRENKSHTKHTPHYEYLFYIEKADKAKYISPLNYIGGKFETLDLILNNLPAGITTCYDLFGGGATVSLNMPARKIIYNDINHYVAELLKYLSETSPVSVYKEIQKYQRKYGLQKAAKKAYYSLRDQYNKTPSPLLLYLLICYGFEHQIRFNSKHEFNNPCGNSGFNDEMYEKLISFYLCTQDKKIDFLTGDFFSYLDVIQTSDFVYLDPPYLGNDGVYQDGKRGFKGWDKAQERQLYRFMEELHSRGIRFMLSNYAQHSAGKNTGLLSWAKKHKFKVVEDLKTTKRNRTRRKEIVIINY